MPGRAMGSTQDRPSLLSSVSRCFSRVHGKIRRRAEQQPTDAQDQRVKLSAKDSLREIVRKTNIAVGKTTRSQETDSTPSGPPDMSLALASYLTFPSAPAPLSPVTTSPATLARIHPAAPPDLPDNGKDNSVDDRTGRKADATDHSKVEYATRTRTPPARLPFFDEDRYPRGPSDVYHAAFLLRQTGLPAELATMVLEAAEYWPVARFRASKSYEVGVGRDVLAGVYFVTPRLRHDQHEWKDRGNSSAGTSSRVRHVEITVTSRDSGYSARCADFRSGPVPLPTSLRADGVPTDGYPTWFEAHVRKKSYVPAGDPKGDPGDPNSGLRQPGSKSHFLVANVQNYVCYHTKRATLSRYDDDRDVAATIRGLKRGDRIVITAHTSLFQYTFKRRNTVREVDVDVYYSFVR